MSNIKRVNIKRVHVSKALRGSAWPYYKHYLFTVIMIFKIQNGEAFNKDYGHSKNKLIVL